MNNISLAIVLCFALILIFILTNKNSKLEIAKMQNEKDRYIDFVKSLKAETIGEFNGDKDKALPEQEPSDIIDVYDADPERLLKSLKQNNENIEDTN